MKIHAEKDENGKSLLGLRSGSRLHAEKDENGKSLFALKWNAALHSEKDGNGKSKFAIKAGAATAVALSKRVLVTFPDGSQRLFDSIRETGRFLDVSPSIIFYRISRGSPKLKSKWSAYRFEFA